VQATGTLPLRFQWRFKGADLAGRTNANLYLERVTTNQAGVYDVVVSNVAGSTNSTPATLTVMTPPPPPPPVPPSILRQPVNQTALSGSNAAFRVEAAGTLPLSFQWRFNGSNLAWGTNPTLRLERVTTANAGTYSCVVSNVAGTVTSTDATLVLFAP
jgi:hypothetical protein